MHWYDMYNSYRIMMRMKEDEDLARMEIFQGWRSCKDGDLARMKILQGWKYSKDGYLPKG